MISPGRSDIAPVALHGKAEDRKARGHQGGEEVSGKIACLPVRDKLHGGGGDDIDTGVYQIRNHLFPGRLLHKADDSSPPVCQHRAVLQRGFMLRQGDGYGTAVAPVGFHQRSQIIVAGAVSGDDKKITVTVKIRAGFYRARRTEGALLLVIFQLQPKARSVPKVVQDNLGPVAQGNAGAADAAAPQQRQNVLQHRFTAEPCHGLRRISRYTFQPCPFPASHDDRFQNQSPHLFLSRFCPYRASAERRPGFSFFYHLSYLKRAL